MVMDVQEKKWKWNSWFPRSIWNDIQNTGDPAWILRQNLVSLRLRSYFLKHIRIPNQGIGNKFSSVWNNFGIKDKCDRGKNTHFRDQVYLIHFLRDD